MDVLSTVHMPKYVELHPPPPPPPTLIKTFATLYILGKCNYNHCTRAQIRYLLHKDEKHVTT